MIFEIMKDKKIHRPVKSYGTLEEIIDALQPGRTGNDQTYVGKQYSKSSLIKDLQKIQNKGIRPLCGAELLDA